MTTIYGLLNIADRDTTVDQVGQQTVYEAVQEIVNRHNEDVEAVTSTFVQETTTIYQENYFLPGGGMMQESTPGTRPGAVKPLGSYTTAYDLLDFKDQVASDPISLAYLTLNRLNTTVLNITQRHLNLVRYQILRHILNKTNDTNYVDFLRGSLTIRRLANTDGTTFPAVIGSDDAADDNHYLVSGYAAADIGDTQNPIKTLRAEIEQHFGPGDLVAFINPAQSDKISALTDFIPVSQRFVREGDATPTLTGSGPGGVPGEIIGRINNTWISEWLWFPANYVLSIDLAQPAPLKKRIDVPESIPGRGVLELVAEQTEYPLKETFWAYRAGFGVANRLSAAVMELTTDGTYDTPATYV